MLAEFRLITEAPLSAGGTGFSVGAMPRSIDTTEAGRHARTRRAAARRSWPSRDVYPPSRAVKPPACAASSAAATSPAAQHLLADLAGDEDGAGRSRTGCRWRPGKPDQPGMRTGRSVMPCTKEEKTRLGSPTT